MVHGAVKPRIYWEKSWKAYLSVARKKNKTRVEFKSAIIRQLYYLKRDLNIINSFHSVFSENPFKEKGRSYVETIRKFHEQQIYMLRNKTHSVPDNVVSIHQPHVRPIVRGKEKSKVEFVSKINMSLVEGYAFLDHLSWDAYNEGNHQMESVDLYRKLHEYSPAEIMVDKYLLQS